MRSETTEAMKLVDAVQGSRVATVRHESLRTLRRETSKYYIIVEQPGGTDCKEQSLHAKATVDE